MITLGLNEVVQLAGELCSEELVGTMEVAAVLGVDVAQVREWAGRDLLPAKKVNGCFVFRVADLAEFKLHAMVNLDSRGASDPEMIVNDGQDLVEI